MFNFFSTKNKPFKNKKYLEKKQLKFNEDYPDIEEYSNKLINNINMANKDSNRNLLEEYLIHIIFLINYNINNLRSTIALQYINKYRMSLIKILEFLSIDDSRYIVIFNNITSKLSGTTINIRDINNFNDILLDLLISDNIYGIDSPIKNKYLKYKYKYYGLKNKIDTEQR